MIILYTFVVDTEQYVGNFERAMCQYMTGRILDNEEDEDEDLTFSPGIFLKMEERPTEHDQYAYHHIVTTPGWYNNGVGGHFRDIPENDSAALEHWKRSTVEYETKYLNIHQAMLDEIDTDRMRRSGWTRESLGRVVQEYRDRIERAAFRTAVNKFPAFLSLGIFFHQELTNEEIEILKSRAHEFAERESLVVTGFRMIEEITITKEYEV
jgi:hypothetical protein